MSSQRLAHWRSRVKALQFQNFFLPFWGVKCSYTRIMSLKGFVQYGFLSDGIFVHVKHWQRAFCCLPVKLLPKGVSEWVPCQSHWVPEPKVCSQWDVFYWTNSYVHAYMVLATFCSSQYCVVSLSHHNINTSFYAFLLWFSGFFLTFHHLFCVYSVSSLCKSLHIGLMTIS